MLKFFIKYNSSIQQPSSWLAIYFTKTQIHQQPSFSHSAQIVFKEGFEQPKLLQRRLWVAQI
jgi:hypothetical protein